jgi:hypothetical protein
LGAQPVVLPNIIVITTGYEELSVVATAAADDLKVNNNMK